MSEPVDMVCPYCGNDSLGVHCQAVEDEDYPTGEHFYLVCKKCNTICLDFDDLVPYDAYFRGEE